MCARVSMGLLTACAAPACKCEWYAGQGRTPTAATTYGLLLVGKPLGRRHDPPELCACGSKSVEANFDSATEDSGFFSSAAVQCVEVLVPQRVVHHLWQGGGSSGSVNVPPGVRPSRCVAGATL